MRAILFHNPSAGHKADKDDILAAMKLADFEVRYVSVKNGDIEKAFEKRTDLIVIAGGDGTITEVLTKVPDRSVPVALLPLGTANNIARSLGIAGMPQELVETWKIDRPIHSISAWSKARGAVPVSLRALVSACSPDSSRRRISRKRREVQTIFAKDASY